MTFFKNDIWLINKIRIRINIINKKQAVSKNICCLIENNSSTIEQNSFIRLEKKKYE